MATKKKTKTKQEPIKDLHASGEQSIGYQGKVSVKIQRGNKIISSKTYHNSGMPNLFRFLANCLAGSISTNGKPVKIKLFEFPSKLINRENSNEIKSPTEFNWNTIWGKDSSPIVVSPFVSYDSLPLVTSGKSTENTDQAKDAETPIENTYYSTTLHFRIPSSYLSGQSVHLIGLYPNSATSDKDDVLAYYLLTDNNEWAPIDLSNITSTFSLIIDWTLAIKNK